MAASTTEPDYRAWWEAEQRRRSEIDRMLDRVLGPNEEDGAGEGLVADVALAISRAWQQGYTAAVCAPANRALGLGDPVNPYADLLDATTPAHNPAEVPAEVPGTADGGAL